jgi:WD40 repeat protein
MTPPHYFDFSDYIADRTRDFVGREWVFAEIDAWLADPGAPRYFIITGEPGIGKTAIAARLTQIRDLDAYHFCIARQADTIDPLDFTRALSHQLAAIDGFAIRLLEEQGVQVDARVNVRHNYGQVIGVHIERLVGIAQHATTAFNRIVINPLKLLYADGFERQLVILVDALDEAAQLRGAETIVDLLANARGLPPQVRFVLTSRPEGEVLRHFERLNIPHLVLDAGRAENQQDVRAYAQHRLATSEMLQARLSEQAMAADTFITRIAEASQGNFLYLLWLLRGIAAGTQRFEKLEVLPQGLDGVYREFLRTRPVGKDLDRWDRDYAPLLGVLAAAQALLTVDQLCHFTGLPKQRVKRLLRAMQQFLDPVSAEKGQYRLYHQSVVDFLADEARAGEFWIDPHVHHEQIASFYRLHFTDCWPACDSYGLAYLVAHLIRAGNWEGLTAVLTDFDFLDARCRATSVYDLHDDYRMALVRWQGTAQDKAALQRFAQRLRLESHHIHRAPELLFPHLYNHLTWLDAPNGPLHRLCERARTQATCTPSVGWLRMIQDPKPAPPLWLRSLEGHTDFVNAVAVTPDGQRAVSGSDDRTLKVWNLASGQLLRSLEGHTSRVNAVALTPDGQQVVSGSDDHTVKVWDLASGQLLRSLERQTGPVNAVAVTPDGQQVVGGFADNTVKVWDIGSGRLLRSIKGHTDRVMAVAVTPDGQQVVSGSDDKTVKVWDIGSGRLLRSLEGHTNGVMAVAVTPDGQHVVSGSWDNTVKVWGVGSGRLLRSLEGHTGPVNAVALTPDGQQVVSGSDDKAVKVWELGSGQLLCSLEGHTKPVNAVAVTPDGQRVVSGSTDNTVKVWDIGNGRLLRSMKGHTDRVMAVAVTPDGQQVVSGSRDNTVKVWDLTGGDSCELFGNDAPILGVALSPDGHWVACGDAIGRVWIFEWMRGT